MPLPQLLYPSGDIPLEEIEDHLKADCESSEERVYFRPLTDEEHQARLEQMPTLDIRIEDLKAEAKAKADHYKGQLKPLEAEKKKTLTEVRAGRLEEKGTTYTLLFHQDGLAGVYNRYGQKIEERRMTAAERQQRLGF